MTLAGLDDLERWHTMHSRRRPVERQAWEAVLTFWIAGCAGAPTAIVTNSGSAALLCAALALLPSAYVELRARLHVARRVRCDWIGACR